MVKENNMEIANQSPEIQERWLLKQGSDLRKWFDLEDYTVINQARVLWEVWDVWEVNSLLSRLATIKWDYDYYKWAKCYSKRRNTREPARETIDNKIRVYRDWMGEELIEYPEEVYLPKRNEIGQLVDRTCSCEDSWKKVEFKPSECEYTKLLVSKRKAKKGKMTPEDWTALLDPYVTVDQLKQTLKGDVIRDRDTDDFHLFEIDGIVYGKCNGKQVPVMQVLFEYSGEEEFSRTVDYIFKVLHLPIPLSYL